MQQVMVIEIGTGVDLHGQDMTRAAVRAARDAIGRNSLPGMRTVLPQADINRMQVRATLAAPRPEEIDAEAVRAVFPYGQVEIRCIAGGMSAQSGVVLPEKGDRSDELLIVNAVVEVGY